MHISSQNVTSVKAPLMLYDIHMLEANIHCNPDYFSMENLCYANKTKPSLHIAAWVPYLYSLVITIPGNKC